jgi:hypothetical protein
LPGVTLPAGKCMFRIVDTTGSRRIVQVLDADGKKPYAIVDVDADAPLPAMPIASALGAASLMAGFAESIGPKMRP